MLINRNNTGKHKVVDKISINFNHNLNAEQENKMFGIMKEKNEATTEISIFGISYTCF